MNFQYLIKHFLLRQYWFWLPSIYGTECTWRGEFQLPQNATELYAILKMFFTLFSKFYKAERRNEKSFTILIRK